ncbi:MAG: ATP-binding protein [Sulfuricella sp.]|nr:ATP-binding protein [Sulfuricella sp.]
MDSLRQKITFGYYAIGALIVGLSLFAFVELRLIEGKVLAGEMISDFFDTTLEIRRFEKNYFLYRQPADAAENAAYVARAQRLLQDNFADFSSLTEAARVAVLRDALERYSRLMTEYVRMPVSGAAQSEALESLIRKAGKEVVTIAEEIARVERKRLQSSLERHRYSLIVSIVVLILLVIAIGQVLSRMVARPLKQMEESMEAVANGRRDQIDIPSADREIVSLTNAFNHVLQELELRQKHLVRSEKLASLGTLLSGVAHELNNPLSNISTSCQILIEELESADPEFKRELLVQIDEQTGRARNIVRSLLDFARDREFKRETLPLAGLIAETLRFIKGQVPSRVAIVTDIPADIEIYGDKQRLQQVFLNLIKNAIEALEGAGEIAIHAVRSDAGQAEEAPGRFKFLAQCNPSEEAVEIEIRDNGHGIPPEVLPRIFDPFFTTKDVGKGSGLGLFVVYEIIEKHGGCIAAESESGKGTAFHIRLPLNKAETGST